MCECCVPGTVAINLKAPPLDDLSILYAVTPEALLSTLQIIVAPVELKKAEIPTGGKSVADVVGDEDAAGVGGVEAVADGEGETIVLSDGDGDELGVTIEEGVAVGIVGLGIVELL